MIPGVCAKQAAEVAALLQWLASELPQLPEPERLEALRCP